MTDLSARRRWTTATLPATGWTLMIAALPAARWALMVATLPSARRAMIAIARTVVPATRRWRTRMIASVTVTVVAAVVPAVVTPTAIPDRTDGDVRVAAVIARSVAITIARVVIAAARLDDRGRFRAVIRIAAGATANVARVVVATRERQRCRESQKQGMRATHRKSLMRTTVGNDFDTAPARLNAR